MIEILDQFFHGCTPSHILKPLVWALKSNCLRASMIAVDVVSAVWCTFGLLPASRHFARHEDARLRPVRLRPIQAVSS